MIFFALALLSTMDSDKIVSRSPNVATKSAGIESASYTKTYDEESNKTTLHISAIGNERFSNNCQAPLDNELVKHIRKVESARRATYEVSILKLPYSRVCLADVDPVVLYYDFSFELEGKVKGRITVNGLRAQEIE